MDWNTFEYTDSSVFLMIYKALEGKAQKQAGAYFEAGGVGGLEKPEDFISFLDQSNWDSTRISRARKELNEMKMGNKQSWNSFLPLWTSKLTEARGDAWPDETKITLLEGTLNMTLQIALASNHLLPPDNYFEWTRIVSHIAQKFDNLTKASSLYQFPESGRTGSARPSAEIGSATEAGRTTNKEWSRSDRDNGASFLDSGGDTLMGGINSTQVLRGPNGKPLRAKWKTQAKIETLRREGRCFRCERKGCNTNLCRLLPAL
ncbi:hypothetical protein K3495_g16455, partial [Podosphaera aphanis]